MSTHCRYELDFAKLTESQKERIEMMPGGLQPWQLQAMQAVPWRTYQMLGARPAEGDVDAWDKQAAAQKALSPQQARWLYTLQLWADEGGVDIVRCMLGAGVPRSCLLGASMHKHTNATSAVDAWRTKADDKPVLMLLGQTGVGKSVAAAHACSELAKAGGWWQAQATGSKSPLQWRYCRDWALTEAEELRHMLAAATTVRCLVLDDVPAQLAPTGAKLLASALSLRADNRRLTILTSNATAVELRALVGDAAADRLRARALVKTVQGQSLR
jgi:hypothetical protein